ncbi:hybrid sensor histidine kinase/response regulator [Chloracidobacterium aggregatum]|uniref:histidine kinase n=1 Tax=Chloracidobacterium sp. N TaxID=2821540 RepID=A0ABX8B1H2_9BACT|nr:hybrid sensor histidine kinase/response regulator [Chloracidobacterium aggregatum]QUV84687.1 hybrid sensor histidine kinase/response regulator [Chloracidobacterium sp. 2]QUV86810.1 hybrid sensor histidine kinase/response regulator [Chloracidobacterium sp. S]QUV91808.1 hybrid sensor histidine kinase/response regulator [Chloracidobacterium sp. A]QUV92941.1 hybrid sensor histidine kinase/response regulator [Chloracidobacterium sp. N]QUV96095.1 hybrid sensor histidine kinase/response regulator 
MEEFVATPSVGLNRRVLVVDDEAEIRLFFKDFLSDCQVCTAADGSEVAPLLASFRPHLVITDLRMPRQGGLAVIELVKAHDPAIEVLMITGYGRIEEAVEAMKLGASDFIPKPFEVEQMHLAIEKCFERVKLRQQNTALQEANRELQRLTELKEKFLRMTSHELRGPLTILQGYCDLLAVMADSPDDVREARVAMQAAISNLTTIVQNLTLLMTTTTDHLPISCQPFDVAALVRTTLEEIKVHARHRQHQYHLAGPEHLPAVGDALRVTQVLRELLFNAVKFTPDHGNIHVRLTSDEPYFTIEIEDNGIGMAAHEVAVAFESFYEVASSQYHSTSRTNFKGGGLGIGLTLVRDVVTAYGGRVSIVSEPGKGTTVTVRFPRDKTPVADLNLNQTGETT